MYSHIIGMDEELWDILEEGVVEILMFLLQKHLKKITIILSKLSSPRTHSSTSLHTLKIKSLATKIVPEEQDHTLKVRKTTRRGG